MTEPQAEDLSRLRAELKETRAILIERLDRMDAALAAQPAIGAGVETESTALLKQELAMLRLENAVRISLVHAQYAMAHSGAITGVPPIKTMTEVLRRSELFDARWYRSSYSDLNDSGLDPLEHYLRLGCYDGRDPGPDFSTMGYYLANPDLAQGGWPALVHYEMFGRAEGRALLPET